VETTTPPAETTAPTPADTPAVQPNGEGDPSSLLGEAEDNETAPAPEPYDPEKITIPEGMTKDDVLFGDFTNLAKEQNLTASQAQALVDLHAKQIQASVQKQSAEWAKTQEDWQAEVRADPDIGGDKLEPGLQTFARFVKGSGLCDPDLLKDLAFTGGGNRKSIVKTFINIAKAFSEGGPIQGSPANTSRAPQTLGEVFYGRRE
jgi:hypothetical protein